MKLDPVIHNEVIMSKPLEEQTFGIAEEDVGVIIEILRDKLYSNKRKIVVQEYMCNARDAQREIGNNKKPIHVKLPNIGMPTFEVRDYGPGITPERMSTVFVRYGASTKRNTNDETGGYGIGAKSAWSYCDQFGIVTYVDGIERHYSAFLDDQENERGRVGKIALLHQCETKELNGTKIIVPIQSDDFKAFIEYTAETCEFWEVRPTFSGIAEGELYFPEYTYHEKSDNWHLVKSNNYRDSNKSFVIVDGIKYPIQMSELDNMDDVSKRILRDDNVHFFFKTGEVSISANRESLYYNEKTKKCISNRIEEMKQTLSKKLGEKVRKCKTYIEAKSTWASLVNSSTVAWNMRTIEWKKGIVIDSSSINASSCGDYINIQIQSATFNNNEVSLSKINGINFPFSNAILVINDAEIYPSKPRLLTLFNNRKDKEFTKIYIISSVRRSCDDESVDNDYLKDVLSKWTKEKHLDGKEIIRLSKVDKTKYIAGVTGSVSGSYNDGCISVKKYNVKNGYLSCNKVRINPKTETGYWSSIFEGEIEFNGLTHTTEGYTHHIRNILEVASIDEFYAVPRNMAHKVTSKNMKKIDLAFNEVVEDKIKSVKLNFKPFEILRDHQTFGKVGTQLLRQNVIESDHPLVKFSQILKEYSEESQKFKSLGDLVKLTNGKVQFELNDTKDNVDFSEEYNKIKNKYPMIYIITKNCGYYSDPIESQNVSSVVEYIKMVDMMESNEAIKKELVELVA